MVPAENNLFEVGATHLMLLSRIARTTFPLDFYVEDAEFVFRVDGPGDQVQRLVNLADQRWLSLHAPVDKETHMQGCDRSCLERWPLAHSRHPFS